MPALLFSGSRGPDVAELQRLLNGHSPTALPRLVADGVFGQNTLNRVREFQRQAGLKVDGLAGPLTLAALRKAPPAPQPSGPPKRVCGNSLAGNEGLIPGIVQRFLAAIQLQPQAFAAPVRAGNVFAVGTPLSVGDAPPNPNALFRRLNEKQQTRIKEVFGESIDFATVFLSNQKGLQDREFTICLERTDIPFPLVPGVGPNVKAIQIMNLGTFDPDDDTLIHEMTHVWQSQHHSNPKQYMRNCVESQAMALSTNTALGFVDASVKRTDKQFPVQFPTSAYAYEPNKVFGDYAGEQVANAVELIDQIVRAHVRSVAKGAVDADNVRSLSVAKVDDRRRPRVRFEKSDPVDLF